MIRICKAIRRCLATNTPLPFLSSLVCQIYSSFRFKYVRFYQVLTAIASEVPRCVSK